jgi:ABC-type branched-subunit amino acid transport system substrate-binding protein
LIAVLVASCQSSSLDEGIKGTGTSSEAPLADQSFGSGPVKAALLVPLTGAMAPAGADVRDGAAMALKDLGQEAIMLTALDTGTSADQTRIASQRAIAAGSSFTAIYGDEPSIAASTTGGVVGLALTENGTPRPPGMFAFLPGPVDSLAAGIIHAAANVDGEAVVFVPDDFSDQDRALLDERLAGRAKYVVVTYTSRDDPLKVAGAAANAAIVGLAGTDSKVSQIVRGVQIGRDKDNRPAVVGHSGWPQSLYQFPELNGAIVALPDRSGYDHIAAAYKGEYNREVTAEAAYGYDAMAIVAGLVRAKGPGGLTRENFLGAAGFRGVTGAFRFLSDGSVQRLFAIFVNQGGKMTRIADPLEGF